MAAIKSSFLDKVLGRIGRLDAKGFKLSSKGSHASAIFLETLFNHD